MERKNFYFILYSLFHFFPVRMMKTMKYNKRRDNNSLRINFQFDIDNSKEFKSTILYFPPVNVKYNRTYNELTLTAKSSEKFFTSIFNKTSDKSKIDTKSKNELSTIKNTNSIKFITPVSIDKRRKSTAQSPSYYYSKQANKDS